MRIDLRDFNELLKRLEELKSFYIEKTNKFYKYHYFDIRLIENDEEIYKIEYNVYRDQYSTQMTLDNPYLGFSREELEDLREKEKKTRKKFLFGKRYNSSMELVLDLKIMLKARDSV